MIQATDHSFFEGPEKKFELMVNENAPSLRSLDLLTWSAIVGAANATILSQKNYPQFDAYLLSESSLFVYDRQVTMITCGRTRLIEAVMMLLDQIGVETVSMLVYERKIEHFPALQHSSFLHDAQQLATQLDGRSLRFGVEHAHRIDMFVATRDHVPNDSDVTIEVLMHGLDPQRAILFSNGPRADRTARSLGLDCLLGTPAAIDEYAFEPAGYSLNAASDSSFYTVHVTPESQGSYASFETNWDFRPDPSSLVKSITQCFAPESFDVLSFVPGHTHVPLSPPPDYIGRKIVHGEIGGYAIAFTSFFRPQGIEHPVLVKL